MKALDNIAINKNMPLTNNNEVNLYKSVKSFYIFKKIFLNLDERKKLNIVKYNRNLVTKFGINIDYVKKISGKYKINGINGYGEEYNQKTNYLIFEGEYLKGKRNGKGKEYDNNSNLIFEGEYLNGKRNYGKEYHKNGKLIFEGKYLYNKRSYGKEYNFKGKLIFKGEYLYGKRWNGKGYNNCKFEIKNGKGEIKIYYYNKNLKFEGEYINGEINGKGKEYDVK